jgi:membrane-bound lytic murein transglycosylase
MTAENARAPRALAAAIVLLSFSTALLAQNAPAGSAPATAAAALTALTERLDSCGGEEPRRARRSGRGRSAALPLDVPFSFDGETGGSALALDEAPDDPPAPEGVDASYLAPEKRRARSRREQRKEFRGTPLRLVAPEQLPPFKEEFRDDAARQTALRAIAATVDYWTRTGARASIGGDAFDAPRMIAGLERLAELVRQSPDAAALHDRLQAEFDIYQSASAASEDGENTAYCTPTLSISRVRTDESAAPIYALPPRAHFSRREISEGKLAGQGLEIGWTNWIDLEAAQVEGAAWGVFTDTKEKVLLSHAGENGFPWVSMSSSLKKCGVDLADLPGCGDVGNYGNLLACLKTLPPDLQRRAADLDPSYVFYKIDPGAPKGAADIELVPDRSIAVDKSVPLGLPGLLVSRWPEPDGSGGSSMQDVAQLVFTHDRGGAIHGVARVDRYAGDGADALGPCYTMDARDRLYVFVLKGTR